MRGGAELPNEDTLCYAGSPVPQMCSTTDDRGCIKLLQRCFTQAVGAIPGSDDNGNQSVVVFTDGFLTAFDLATPTSTRWSVIRKVALSCVKKATHPTRACVMEALPPSDAGPALVVVRESEFDMSLWPPQVVSVSVVDADTFESRIMHGPPISRAHIEAVQRCFATAIMNTHIMRSMVVLTEGFTRAFGLEARLSAHWAVVINIIQNCIKRHEDDHANLASRAWIQPSDVFDTDPDELVWSRPTLEVVRESELNSLWPRPDGVCVLDVGCDGIAVVHLDGQAQ